MAQDIVEILSKPREGSHVLLKHSVHRKAAGKRGDNLRTSLKQAWSVKRKKPPTAAAAAAAAVSGKGAMAVDNVTFGGDAGQAPVPGSLYWTVGEAETDPIEPYLSTADIQAIVSSKSLYDDASDLRHAQAAAAATATVPSAAATSAVLHKLLPESSVHSSTTEDDSAPYAVVGVKPTSHYEVPLGSITNVRELGRGQYGMVFLAKVMGLLEPNVETLAAVKSLHTQVATRGKR